MVITIKNEDSRFGVRVAALIFNSDMTKIFMQKQENNDYYMFPGGRLDIHEDSANAICRELYEELGIQEEVNLKYLCESFINFPKGKYHEIGFYFIVKIDEKKYGYAYGNEYDSKDEENDGKSKFKWLDVDKLDEFEIMPKFMKEKINEIKINMNIQLEKITYREYE